MPKSKVLVYSLWKKRVTVQERNSYESGKYLDPETGKDKFGKMKYDGGIR